MRHAPMPAFTAVSFGAALTVLSASLAGQAVHETTDWPMFRLDPRHAGAVSTRGVDPPGGIRWELETAGPVRSSAAVVDGVLYVGSDAGGLHAVDVATGRPMWRYRAGAAVSGSPAVAGDLVLVTDASSTLHAVGVTDGAPRWQVRTGPTVPFPWGREGWDYFASSPVPVRDLVVFGAGDGKVRAVELTTGAVRWSFATGGRIRSTPAISGETVYVGSADGHLYAIDLASGEERWRFATEGASLDAAEFGFDRRTVQGTPVVADGTVFVGGRDANLYAVDAATGSLRWSSNDGTTAWVVSAPAVFEHRVYETRSSSGLVRALDVESGEELWRTELGGFVFVSPVVVGELLYAASEAGDLAALDRMSGEIRWTLPLGGPVYASPVVLDGVLYIGADDGIVRAVEAAAGPPPRRAVYWDSTRAGTALVGRAPAHRRLVQHLTDRGWEVVDGAGLEAMLAEATRTEARSVVVFAMDALPPSVASVEAVAARGEGTLLERYLASGGKAVWIGFPPFFLRVEPDTGARSTDPGGAEPLSGVDESPFTGDTGGQWPTASGRRWGLEGWWRGFTGLDASSRVRVLAVDARGRATAWVHGFGGPAGTGFVRFLDVGMSEAEMEAFRRMAEYGVFRPAVEASR